MSDSPSKAEDMSGEAFAKVRVEESGFDDCENGYELIIGEGPEACSLILGDDADSVDAQSIADEINAAHTQAVRRAVEEERERVRLIVQGIIDEKDATASRGDEAAAYEADWARSVLSTVRRGEAKG